MQTFQPVPVPPDAPEWFQRWARAHDDQIRKAAASENDSLRGRYLAVAPTRPQDGAIYLAEGSAWNPGSGKGAYRYDASSASYVFLG
jgi:hypothetical protein